MVRQVHGPGTLVPVDIRWIAARTQGRVDKIVLLPGATVEPDSVIMVLSNPDVTQAALDTQSQLKAGEADYANLKVTVQQGVLQSESDAATAKADFEEARLQAQVNEQLFKDGLVSELGVQALQGDRRAGGDGQRDRAEAVRLRAGLGRAAARGEAGDGRPAPRAGQAQARPRPTP